MRRIGSAGTPNGRCGDKRRQRVTPPRAAGAAADSGSVHRPCDHSRLYRRSVPLVRKQAPPPLQVDTLRIVLAGTALWAIALVVLLLLGDRVDPLWKWT